MYWVDLIGRTKDARANARAARVFLRDYWAAALGSWWSRHLGSLTSLSARVSLRAFEVDHSQERFHVSYCVLNGADDRGEVAC
jgi:hypothetical protein